MPVNSLERPQFQSDIAYDLWGDQECSGIAALLPSGRIKSFKVPEFVVALRGWNKKCGYEIKTLSENEERLAGVLTSFTRVAPSFARVIGRQVEYEPGPVSDFLPLGKRVICVPLANEWEKPAVNRPPFIEGLTDFI